MASAWDSSHAPSRPGRADRGRSSCATTSSPTSRSTGAGCCGASAPSCATATGRPRRSSWIASARRTDADAARAIGGPRLDLRRGRPRRGPAHDLHVICDLESAAAFSTQPHRARRAAPAPARRRRAHGDPRVRARRGDPLPARHQPAPARPRYRSSRLAARRARDRPRGSRATSSRWRISATGRMPRSRPTADHSASRSPTRSRPASGCARRVTIRVREIAPRRAPRRSRCASRCGAADRSPRSSSARRRHPIRRRPTRPSVTASWWSSTSARRTGAPRSSGRRRSGLPLDVRAILAGDAPSRRARRARRRRSRDLPLLRVAAFDPLLHVTDAAAAAALRSALAAAGVTSRDRRRAIALHRVQPRAREHPARPRRDRFATTPLFHSLGTEQLVESVADAAADRRADAVDGGRTPVHVGPIVLRPRFNDVATARSRCRPGTTSPRATGPSSPAPRPAAVRARARRVDDRERRGSRIPGSRASRGSRSGGRAASARPSEPRPRRPSPRALGGAAGCDCSRATAPTDWRGPSAPSRREAVVLVANLDRRARELTLVVDGASTSIPLEPLAFIRLALP